MNPPTHTESLPLHVKSGEIQLFVAKKKTHEKDYKNQQ